MLPPTEQVGPERARQEPGAAPLLAPSLEHCPSAYVLVAQCDVLRDQSVAYAQRLRARGVDTTLDEVPRVLHGFMSLLGLREARQALQRSAALLRGRLL